MTRKINLAIACFLVQLCCLAQNQSGDYYSFKSFDADATFRSCTLEQSNIKFDFLFPVGNRMRLDFRELPKPGQLPNVTAISVKAWNVLRELSDSLDDPQVTVRVDILIMDDDIKLRLRRFAVRSEIYYAKGDEIVQLKTEQDTLNIAVFDPDNTKTGSHYSYVRFYLNYLSNLGQIIQSGKIDSAVQRLEADLVANSNSNKIKTSKARYYALYDLEISRRLAPEPGQPWKSKPHSRGMVWPHISAGLQYTRGSWVPMAQVGVSLIHNFYDRGTRTINLLWEPAFDFSKTVSSKIETHRNDFITIECETTVMDKFSFRAVYLNNFSVSYLVRNKGGLFNSNTFKLSIPRFKWGYLSINPELVFNGLFKNLSPSIKLNFIMI